jgi:carboxymethylenebutenolidase
VSFREAQVLSLLVGSLALAAVDAKGAVPKGKSVELRLPGGGTSTAYVARPRRAARGGLLLLHEWWGLNDWVRSEADRYATQGYLVLAVDLFGGLVAADADQAQKLMSALDDKAATDIEVAGIDWLAQALPGKKIATLGWSMGGGQSLNASLASGGKVAATVIYYGVPVTDVNLLKKLQGPVLGIWAKRDGWVTPEKAAGFDLALKDAGIKHEFRSYDADHAFANPTGGRYNAAAAQDASEATHRFLKSILK